MERLIKVVALIGVFFASAVDAGASASTGAGEGRRSPCPERLVSANRPIAPAGGRAGHATFVDPTATVRRGRSVRVSDRDYVAPFARLDAASKWEICIEEGSNVQDNAVLWARRGGIRVGKHAIIAHNAVMVSHRGRVSIAHRSACPLPAPGRDPMTLSDPAARGRQALANALAEAGASRAECDEIPAFIGFNALNLSAIGDGALLGVGSRLRAGVVLRPGYVSFPGKSLDTQAEADDLARGEVRLITAGDVVFMQAVLEVNECLARGYVAMRRAVPSSVRGINIDPGVFHLCEFNPSTEAPTIEGEVVRDPTPRERVRIIGDARLADIDHLAGALAIRADEGEPFIIGRDVRWGGGSTLHALEPSAEDPDVGITIGDNVVVGRRVVIHGGGRRPRVGGIGDELTTVRAGSTVGNLAVVFRADLAEHTVVGAKALVIGYDSTRPGEVIPSRCVKFSDTPENECAYFAEW